MFNKKLKFKVVVSHRGAAVAALEGRKDVTQYMARSSVMCWRRGVLVCVLKCQNEPAEIDLQNAVVRTRQLKTIPRNMAVWVTVNQPSKRCRNRFVQCCFKCTLITIATATSFPQSYRFFLVGDTCRVDTHTVCA